MHLLNESTTPELAHADLPPISALQLPTSFDRPLLHWEPDSSHRLDATSSNAPSLLGRDALQSGDDALSGPRRRDGRRENYYAGTAAVHPLQLLLSDANVPEPLQYGRVMDDPTDGLDDAIFSKRSLAIAGKDDFVQLPQPVKQQKTSDLALPVPPIIKPLLEPPPHAALFPPIESSSLADNRDDGAVQARTPSSASHLEDGTELQFPASDAELAANKNRKRAKKPRRKWTDEETRHLLLGVHKHGVGKWTNILEDENFKFNERTAGDLKDRFRTCCPEELRGSMKTTPTKRTTVPLRIPKQAGGKEDAYEQTLEQYQISGESPASTTTCDADVALKSRKSRAHRKNMGDLAQLGIHGPFKKSHRRERRAFTCQDDREILQGLAQYGPAWSKIQRDPGLNLSTRQPTDLRDRVRNKYPTIYQRIEKGTFTARDVSNGTDTLEPVVDMNIDNSFERPRDWLSRLDDA